LKYNIKKGRPTFYTDIKKVVEKSIWKIQEKNYLHSFGVIILEYFLLNGSAFSNEHVRANSVDV
jgi:hypothetical protein